MKQIAIGLGGHPLVKQDVEFMQTAWIEMMKMFLDNFIGDAVYLSDMTVDTASSPGNVLWSAGYLYMNGEIFQVDSGSAVYSGINQNWEVAVTNDPAGSANYEDGNTVNTYKIRKAALTGTTGGSYKYTNFKRLKNYREFGATMSSLGGDWNTTGTPIAPQYNKDLLGNVFFNGLVNNASFNNLTDELLFTLPAGYRPNIKKYYTVAGLVAAAPTPIQISVDTNGEIRVLGVANTSAVTVYLSGLVISTSI